MHMINNVWAGSKVAATQQQQAMYCCQVSALAG
jgi:hypothetical protein